jgi:hypothetical protein
MKTPGGAGGSMASFRMIGIPTTELNRWIGDPARGVSHPERSGHFPRLAYDPGRGFSNTHEFETVRLWEHAERIRSGECREPAPLLLLCEDTSDEATLRHERELILSLGAPRPVQADLLAVAMMVGMRFFARG